MGTWEEGINNDKRMRNQTYINTLQTNTHTTTQTHTQEHMHDHTYTPNVKVIKGCSSHAHAHTNEEHVGALSVGPHALRGEE